METNWRTKYILWIFSVFQLAILFGMLIMAMQPLMTGEKMTLKIEAQDPRDIFRGNYVVLNYDFSLLDLSETENDLPDSSIWHYGDVLYIEMQEVDTFYETKGVWVQPPEGKPFLKGIVGSTYYHYKEGSGSAWLYLNCGIESYYTDPKHAKFLEKVVENVRPDTALSTISATVMVTSSGVARIKQINVIPPLQ